MPAGRVRVSCRDSRPEVGFGKAAAGTSREYKRALCLIFEDMVSSFLSGTNPVLPISCGRERLAARDGQLGDV